MIAALNQAIALRTEHLIIISDLQIHEERINLEESDTLKYVVVYAPDDGSEDEFIMNELKKVWDKAIIYCTKITK